MKILHIVATIYNIGKPDKDWFYERFKLFEEFTIPSIENQTEKNFFWFVFIDGATPIECIRTIQQKIKHYGLRVIIVPPSDISNETSVYATFPIARKALLSQIKSSKGLLVTSGLDNDDAISIDYIEEVQKKVNELEDDHDYVIDVYDEFNIDYRFGEYGINGSETTNVASVTCTTVERFTDPKTIMIGMHGTVWNNRVKPNRKTRHFERRFIISATCLHIVHGENNGLVDQNNWRVKNPRPLGEWKDSHGDGYPWLKSLFRNRSF